MSNTSERWFDNLTCDAVFPGQSDGYAGREPERGFVVATWNMLPGQPNRWDLPGLAGKWLWREFTPMLKFAAHMNALCRMAADDEYPTACVVLAVAFKGKWVEAGRHVEWNCLALSTYPYAERDTDFLLTGWGDLKRTIRRAIDDLYPLPPEPTETAAMTDGYPDAA